VNKGRFKTQALLDDAALLTCMTYVDLNPVRAGMAKTSEDSDYTSIQERIKIIKKTKEVPSKPSDQLIPTPAGLMPFIGGEHIEKEQGIPFDIADYLQLTDWTGRAVRNVKAGAIMVGVLVYVVGKMSLGHSRKSKSYFLKERYYLTVTGLSNKRFRFWFASLTKSNLIR